MNDCIKCGATGSADATGRCYDCVNKDFKEAIKWQTDKRSMWKLRDIEQVEMERRLYGCEIKR